MPNHAGRIPDHQVRAAANQPSPKQAGGRPATSLVLDLPEARRIVSKPETLNRRPRAGNLSRLLPMIDQSLRMLTQREQTHRMFGTEAPHQAGGAGNRLGTPANKRAALQRVKVPPDKVGADAEVQAAELLFNPSRLNRAPIYSKTVSIPDNNDKEALKGYYKAISTVGNKVANFSYLDQALVNPPLPAMAAWAAGRPGYLALLSNVYQISADYLDRNIFPATATRNEVSDEVDRWRDHRGILQDKIWVGHQDPFILRVVLASVKPGQEAWEIDTQFNDSATGYITRVQVGNKGISGKIVSPADFALLSPTPAAAADEYVYSSTHTLAGPDLETRMGGLAPPAPGDTRGGQDVGLDAVTWLAAEGARFIPVAELGGAARPNSIFYTKPKAKGWKDAMSVNLQWLAWNWGAFFGRRYNITAEEIATVVAVNGANINSKPGGVSYNLSTRSMNK